MLKTSLYKAAVLGGDLRQVYLAETLAEHGICVSVYGVCQACSHSGIQEASSLCEVLKAAHMVAAPVPFYRNGSIPGSASCPDFTGENLLNGMKPESILFAGAIPEEIQKQAEERRIQCIDFLQEHSVITQNTIATAEGILAEAITRSPRTLFQSHCLVLGYGTCGSTLVSYLKRLGCHVAVCEKEKVRSLRAQITADRSVCQERLPEILKEADFIFNTAPAMVLPKAMLGYVRKDCLILDLASAPGGVDYKAAEEMGIEAVLLPGIPGKYAPASLGECMAKKMIESFRQKVRRKEELEGE